MRRQPTDAENLLWQQLRNRRFLNLEFRRQVPVGEYIVDFLCEELAIVIELDGGQHVEQRNYDEPRSRWLSDKKFRVIRFWNNDVVHRLDSVMEQLSVEMSSRKPSA